MSVRLSSAQIAWNQDVPDWVAALITQCDQTSQNSVAKALGISAAVVSQVIHNNYASNMLRTESLIRDAFLNAPVDCPALRETIASADGLAWRQRAKKRSRSGPVFVHMRRACLACPKFKPEAEE